MPKYANDVNKQTKIIDIQKQFPGGLKTVDTDDALGQVYLREAENVSLSEFSFLEKRYGLGREEIFAFQDQFPNIDRIQGYFEYVRSDNKVDKLLFANGDVYLKRSEDALYQKVEYFESETTENYQYPPREALEDIFTVDLYQSGSGSLTSPNLIVLEQDVGVLNIAVSNRDFDPANIYFSIDDGSYQFAGELTYLEEFEIPGIQAPSSGETLNIKAYAEDPLGIRPDSAVFERNYTEYKEVVATFDTAGGSPSIDPISEFTSQPVYIDVPTEDLTKTGYTFREWSPELPTTISESTTFTAQYDINSYTISYDTAGGTFIEPDIYNYQQTTSAPSNPSRSGYYFDGWFADAARTQIFSFGNPMPAENLTVYAKWVQVTLRMRVIGEYNDAIGTNVGIVGGGSAQVTIPEESIQSAYDLTGSYTTISSSINPGSDLTVTAPSSIETVSPYDADLTWNFAGYRITLDGAPQTYFVTDNPLENPIDPGGVGVFIELLTTKLATIEVVYRTDRPTYTINVTSNRTSGDRYMLVAIPDNSNNWQRVNFGSSFTIEEGQDYQFFAAAGDYDWNYVEIQRTDNGDEIVGNFGGARPVDRDAYPWDDYYAKDMYVLYSEPAPVYKPPLPTISATYDANAGTVLFSATNNTTVDLDTAFSAHEDIVIANTYYTDYASYSNGIGKSLEVDETYSNPTYMEVDASPGGRAYLHVDIEGFWGADGTYYENRVTYVYEYTVPQIT